MRRFRFWPRMALVFAVGVMHGGCILIPEIKDRIVELALTGTTTQSFVASGVVNVYADSITVDLGSEIDLATILADARVDPSDVSQIMLSGVSYRVVVPDPNPGRHIDGDIYVHRQGLTEHALVTGLSEDVNAVTGFKTATLDANGVADLNNLLAELLEELKSGGAIPANKIVTFAAYGTSSPTDASTSFTWELKITVGVVGTVQVSVPT